MTPPIAAPLASSAVAAGDLVAPKLLNDLAPALARPGWWDRRARGAIDRLLGGLDAARLEVEDGDGVRRLGASGAELVGRCRVLDPGLYRRLLLRGSLAFAEGYIDGDWTTPDLVGLLRVFTRHGEAIAKLQRRTSWTRLPLKLMHSWRRNSRSGSRANIASHYDLGNAFFERWLDPTMMYSAAVYPTPTATLAEAQQVKLDRICDKLELSEGDHLLEIGTGWGGLAIHAARTRGCRVTTTTISIEQHRLATERVAAAGLADRVTVLRQDYRELEGRFDKLVSIEMIEAVGHQYLDGFIKRCADLLRPDGAMLLQAITFPDERWHEHTRSTDFLQQVIFPGSCLPSVAAITAGMAKTDLRLAHLEELTPHYARTLADWRAAFLDAGLEGLEGADERFARGWEYYLASCEAAFAERLLGSLQLLLIKPRSRVGLAQPGLGLPASPYPPSR